MGKEITQQPFLEAEWRKLLLANYPVSPDMLQPWLPRGVELDFWKGACYVSLVGFMFLHTKVKGMAIPFHRHFPEINLRFYVKRQLRDGYRRGVIFIREIVPKPAISFVANTLYKERYVTRKMRRLWTDDGARGRVVYSWAPMLGSSWKQMEASYQIPAQPMAPGSEVEFITEHYWGYAKHGSKTMEYEVRHPRWEAYPLENFSITGNLEEEYGPEFGHLLKQAPASVFLAEGSAIQVMPGRCILR